ncbi:hypothetical protein Zmor_000957 [Zophobas morio]|uniref:Reverse transcriptase domain-containing protein n=1 Tax=Zophobas morio TaxID=2755281 RepID=A0AA38J117_9CUCU|nr:hypothetical protein Zmor_000957 [Zophobas morio]
MDLSQKSLCPLSFFVPYPIGPKISTMDVTAVESGVPQGSVVGPFLFITYIADLKTEIQSRCLFTLYRLYTDDLKIYNDSPTNYSILSKDISIVN